MRFLLLTLFLVTSMLSARAQVVMTTGQPNVDSFPVVRIPVSVAENNKPATGVTVSNFTVKQDGIAIPNVQLVSCQGSPSAAIVFVVDTSQSMEQSVGSGPSAKRNYQKFFDGFSAFIASIPAPSQIALVEFAQYSSAWPGAPRWFFASSTIDTTEFLIDLEAGFPTALGGWTNLDSGIVAGAGVLSHTINPRKIMVIVSDDSPSEALGDYLASRGITAYFMDVERNRGTQTNYPAVGLVTKTGGMYFTAIDTMTYTPTMLSISQSIFAEHCILRYVSPDPCPWWKSHVAQINLDYKTTHLSNAYPFSLGSNRVDKSGPTFEIDSARSIVRYIKAYDPFPCESGMWTLKDSLLKNFRRVSLPLVTSDSAMDSLVVLDSMAPADAWYLAADSAGNVTPIHIHFEPPADVLPPVFATAVWGGAGINTIDVTEQRAWDRKLRSIILAPGALNLVLDSVHYYTNRYARAYLRILNTKDSAGGCLVAVDSFNNTSTNCFTYPGEGKDVLPPMFAQDPIAIPRGVMTGTITENRIGDQGIKNVNLTPVANSKVAQVSVVSARLFTVKASIGDTLYPARTFVEAWDTAGNHMTDTMRYDPQNDSYLPVITHTTGVAQSYNFSITEINAWDRGIKSVQFFPTSTNATATVPVFTDRWHATITTTVTDNTQDAAMIVMATDSVGHVSFDTARFVANAPPKPIVPLGDSSLDFGSLVLPGSSANSITFINTNDVDLPLSLGPLTGDDSVFALTSARSITIAAHSTAAIAFDYHPRWIGMWKAVCPIMQGTDKLGSVTLTGQSTGTFRVSFDKVNIAHVGESGVLTLSLDADPKPINLDNIQITVQYDRDFVELGDPQHCTGALDTGICLYDASWTGGSEGNRIATLTRKTDKLASALSFDRSQIRIPFKTVIAPHDTTFVHASAGSATLAAMLSATDGMITAGDTCGSELMRAGMNGKLEVNIIGIHPNPATSTIDLHLRSTHGGDASVSFVSMLGRTERSIPLHLIAGEQVISLSNLPEHSGVYELLISSGASIVRERVEILR